MEPIIKVRIDSLVFPEEVKPALSEINLDIYPGEMVAITGAAASGKSLLLHAITSAVPKFFPCQIDGFVEINGEKIADFPLAHMADHLGYMMQEPQNQILNRRVKDELAFGIANMNLKQPEIEKRIMDVINFLSMEDYVSRTTDRLSGGQAQKVVLGSVLAMKTPILLLDQPTAELDPKTSSELYRFLKRLNQEKNLTIMIVMDKSHDLLKDVDRVLVMDKGRIKEDLKPEDYRQKYCWKEIISRQPVEIDFNNELISLEQVSYVYKGGVTGCQNINFSIKKGEFTAVIGQNGAGKSTMLKLIEGLLRPASGQIKLFGQVSGKKNINLLRRRIGFLFQNPDDQIFLDSVKDEIGYVLRNKKISEEEKERKIQDTIIQMGLEGLEDVHPQRLSRGQRQLLALGSVIVGEPELIIADEPTSGLNEAQGQIIMEKLSMLSEQGNTILLVTHNLSEAENYANRIVVIHKNKLVLDFEASNMAEYKNQLIEYEIMKGDD